MPLLSPPPRGVLFRAVALLALSALLGSCSKPETALERIKRLGYITVLTRNSPTTYYEGPNGPTGFEYDLARRFAEHLGVHLRVVVTKRPGDIISMISEGKADFAAAGLAVTDSRLRRVVFGPVYEQVSQQLVYRIGGLRPKTVDDLQDGILEVPAGSSQEELLQRLKKQHPNLTWFANKQSDSNELLYLVWQQLIDFTIADSNTVRHMQQFYPTLRVAFDVGEPERLAWAFPPGADDSLLGEVLRFFHILRTSGELNHLMERHFGHVKRFDYVQTRTFLSDIKLRLPPFIGDFREAAKKYNFDWRLLAAMAYQESGWDPKAVSPTGVRGIMMLTLNTARALDVKSRLNPEQSIMAGARYLRQIKDRLPLAIREPDRTWMALAAYNVGYGHLSDAGIIVARRNGRPNLWSEIKKALPLLSRAKWYEKATHGYARGYEPVRYVENIRRYYDLLVRATEPQMKAVPETKALTIEAPAL